MTQTVRILPVPIIISTIEKCQSGKYVVVEGVDDIVVYRNLITLYRAKGIKVLPAGGRDKVLEVFDNLSQNSHINKAIFIVDQDSWVFSGIPSEYQHERIICTGGYSIENDVYLDKQLEDLSLHVDWQSKLFSLLKEQNSTNQFIISTHSPFIYSLFPDKELIIDSDKGCSEFY